MPPQAPRSGNSTPQSTTRPSPNGTVRGSNGSQSSSQTDSTQGRPAGQSSRRGSSPLKKSASRRTSPAAGSSGPNAGGSKDRPITISSSDTEEDHAPPVSIPIEIDDSDSDDDWASAVCSIRSLSDTPEPSLSILSVSPRVVNPFASREARDAYHRELLEAQADISDPRTVVVSDDDQHPTSDDETSTIRDQAVMVAQNGDIVLDEHNHVPPGFFSLPDSRLEPLPYEFSESVITEEMVVSRPASPAFSHIHLGSEIGTDARHSSVAPEHMDEDHDGSRPPTPPLDIDNRGLRHSSDMDISPLSAPRALPQFPVPEARRSSTSVQAARNVRLSPTPDLLMEGLPSDDGDSRPPTPPLPQGFNPSPERIDSTGEASTPQVRDAEQGFSSLKRGFPAAPRAEQVERPAKRSLLDRMSSPSAPPPRGLSLIDRIAMADRPQPLDERPVNLQPLSTDVFEPSKQAPFGDAVPLPLTNLPSRLDFIPKLQDPSLPLELTQEVITDARSIDEDEMILDHEPVEELAPYVDSSTQTSPPPPELPWPIIAHHGNTLDVASPLVRMLIDELAESKSKCLAGWEIAFVHGQMPFKVDLRALVESVEGVLVDIEDEKLCQPYTGNASGSQVNLLQGEKPRLIIFPSGTRDIDYDLYARHKDTSHVDVLEFLDLVTLARKQEREAEVARRKAGAEKGAAQKAAAQKAAADRTAAQKVAAQKAAAQKAAARMAAQKAKVNVPPVVAAGASLAARLDAPDARPFAGRGSLPPQSMGLKQPSQVQPVGQSGQGGHRSTLWERMEDVPTPSGTPPTGPRTAPRRPSAPTNGPSTANGSSKPLHESMN